MRAEYFVWSNEHRQWWAPGCIGYTPALESAGRYTRAQAIDICRQANAYQGAGEVPNEIPVSVADMEETAAPGA